jgi:SAM-dependent methyltransferase
VPDRRPDQPPTSWRVALAPGESHDFYETPGWWDLREIGREPDDPPRLRAALLGALPPLPDGSAVLDLGAGTGTLLTLMAGYYPRLRYTLIDANPAALDRAAEKLRAVGPGAPDPIAVTLIAEAVDPLAENPLPGGPYRLITSSIALHDIARPAAPDDEPGRARHAAEHAALLRRVLTALEPGGHFIYADAMRPRFRVWEHLSALAAAGFAEVDCAYVLGRMLVCGGQRPT